MALFRNRADAGSRLAEKLAGYRDERPLVLALPRGGVPVAYEVARALGAPLDLLVARKLGAPDQPELGIGAVAPGGVRLLNEHAVQVLGISEEYLQEVTRREMEELERRQRTFRGGQPPPDLRDRSVILVDDGLATGITARAAVASVRLQSPRRVVLAVPVCAPEAATVLGREVDEIVCLARPDDFRAVGLWYEDFEQTSDEQVVELLGRACHERGTGS